MRIAILLLVISLECSAASRYIRAGASGAGNGSSWADAWATFGSVSWVRGDTYYVAAGTYNENVSVSSSLSGSLWVMVKRANESDNSGDAGWISSYSGLATIAGTLSLNNGYVSWDGYEGSGTNGHGFLVASTNLAGSVVAISAGTSNFKLLRTEVRGSGFSASSNALDGISWANVTPQKGLLCASNWIHSVTRNGITLGSVVGTGWDDPGATFDGNVISETGGCLNPDIHGQGVQVCYDTEDKYLTFSRCIFQNNVGSAAIAFLGGSGAFHSEARIINNIFRITDNSTYRTLSPGVIWSHDGASLCSNILIANNTFLGIGNSTNSGVLAHVDLTTVGATGNLLQNNVFEACHFTKSHSGVTNKNNGYYGNSGSGIPFGTDGQINGSSTTLRSDLRLIDGGYGVGSGSELSQYFSSDFSGSVRVLPWDIGAYEFNGYGGAVTVNVGTLIVP